MVGDVHRCLIGVLEEARRRGFLGPGPVEHHIVHARAYGARLGDDPGPVADLGSGGGVPGLVLAVGRPDARWVLIEANRRRCAFLVEAVTTLDLADRVAVVRGRAEAIGRDPLHRGQYRTVVARAFGPSAVTAECGAPLLTAGGRLLVSEPPPAPAEPRPRWPAEGLDRLGLSVLATVPGPPRLAVLAQVRPCPHAFPRRVGVPSKRPLW